VTFGRWGAKEGIELRGTAGAAGSNQENASAVVIHYEFGVDQIAMFP